ncbi:MAG: glycosyltransferase family 9 protein [Candidatus Eisenbacteria bacterium]|uniref:Glycosyltransferase family 9 protein n=1 Tax=Eiseniibacteriota bacterium TaxID=2212470 RepID=A0A849SM99_UNCEI|nr:glycosyltransferase family 9 protein [Candidatus Eisenbacteria bacterium]
MAQRAGAIAIPDGGFRRIEILRLSSLGDVVLALPVVHALAAAFPSAHLRFWVKEEFADAVRFDPAIAHVRSLDPDARRIEDLISMSAEMEASDLIVDLHRSVRTRVLTWRQKAPILSAPSYRLRRGRWVRARWSGPAPVPSALERYAQALASLGVTPTASPRLACGDAAEQWAADWMTQWSPATAPIVCCPAAHHFTKRWPQEHWIALDRSLAALGRPRLYLSLARERRSLPELSQHVESAADARWCSEPLARMAALVSHAAGAVTNDTGLMHVAAARGARVVALFGSTSPVLGFAPAGAGHIVLCRNEPCQPCTLHGRTECPLSHFRCMRELQPAQVLTAVEKVLSPRVPESDTP